MSQDRLAVDVRGLRKAFGDKVVLDGIDLAVNEGLIFALLGPNGAGKTTCVQILSTLIGFDEGTALVAGQDVREAPDGVRRAIGVTGQFSAVDNLLTAAENLRLIADLHHLRGQERAKRIGGLLERFELGEERNAPARTLSGGMRRRLDLAMTLVGDPQIIFLDEPTTGLDPRSRLTMWQITRDLAAGGVTIFLTTQNLDEADRLADRIAVLDNGKIIAEGAPGDLKRRIPGGHVLLRFADIAALGEAADTLGPTTRDVHALTLQVPGEGDTQMLHDLLHDLDRASIHVESVSVHSPDLDDAFLALTGSPRERESA